jgi:hypothetical protein
VLDRHHRAFLSMFKQMMVGVFGPGMEQVFSRVSPHAYSTEVGKPVLLNQQELNHHCRASQSSPLHKALGQPIQPPPQSVGSQPIQPPPHSAGSQPMQPPLRAGGGGGTASPATSARQCRSTSSTAKSISAYIWGNGVRLVWTTAQFHLQDSSS